MPDNRVLAVFVKAPLVGTVKTRLGAAVGHWEATQVYRRVGRLLVRASAAPYYRTVVWYTPARRGRAVRAWLRGPWVSSFRPQVNGDLGRRLRAAFASHFAEGAASVVVIGSDCPGVGRRVIVQAFHALERCDVVLGPALDGGYYLIGLTGPRPSLFDAIPWSSARVLAETEARARTLSLSTSRLAPLRDVDTLTDARALGLLPGS
jgi:rSAM/selenodomain-associated transferase 1